ncbi:MFS transporter [Desulfovibrio sp. OttesenSCG-928-C06]|nr:MFS transporter [Desulfovibrio sp. OttesenSCG-928-C06]
MFSTTRFITKHRNWCLFTVMAGATLIACFQQVGLAAVSGEVAESLRIDVASLGLLAAAFSYSYAAMQIPAGLLADTLGPRKSVTAALVLAAAATTVFAFSSDLGTSIIARVVMGMGLAVISVPQLKLIAVWFPISAFQRLTAIAFAISAIGPLFATSPMAYASANYGWRTPFVFLAVASLVFAVLIWLIVRDCPDKVAELIDTSGSGQGTANVTMRQTSVPGGMRLMGKLRCITTTRDAWILGLWQFFQGGTYFAFIGLWGGQFLTSGLGIGIAESGLILSLPSLALVSAPFISIISEKIGSARKMLLFLSCASVLLTVPLVIGLPRLPDIALSLYFLLFAVACFGGTAVLFTAAKEHFAVELAGTISGFINMFPFVGGAMMQQGMGLLVEHWLEGGMDAHRAISLSFGVFLLCALGSLLLAIKYRDAEPYDEKCKPCAQESGE